MGKTLGEDTLQVLINFTQGESYSVTKDRPEEIRDLLPKLENLGLLRKTNRYTYALNASNRKELIKLIDLKSLDIYLDILEENNDISQGIEKDEKPNQANDKRYILFIKTQTDTQNVVSINIDTLKYIIDHQKRKESQFMLGGTTYFIHDLLQFKIYEFESEESIDKFIAFAEKHNLKSKTIFDESYFSIELLAKYGKDVSGIFLDNEINKKTTNKVETDKKMIDVFISHSSSDVEKVKLLIGILRTALNLRKEQIRCTSVAGYKLKGGISTDKTLKQEIVDCKVFIGVLTEKSIISTYVLFELGARWGLNKEMKPLVCEPVMSNVVKGPLTGLHCLNGSEASEIIQLVEECAVILDIKAEASNVYLEESEKFAALSKKKVTSKNTAAEDEGELTIKVPNANIDVREIEKIILNNAKRDYPEDYGTQEFVFNEQMDAFRKLQNPPKEWLSLPQFENISSKAATEHPEDYDTQLYVIDEKISALLRLNKKHS